jgi:ABC-type phosphate/phosphonate transport system permease subunit
MNDDCRRPARSQKRKTIPPAPLTPTRFFKKRKTVFTLIFLALLALTAAAAIYTRFKPETVFTAVPRVARWVVENLIPVEIDTHGIRLDAAAVERMPHILQKLTETILMSVMASMTASLFSFILALLGSRTTQLNKPLALLSRAFSSINRNIPVAVWALIFLISFGQSTFTGFLALFFYSFGFMSRVFTETIDEASASSVEALRAVGASYSQVIFPAPDRELDALHDRNQYPQFGFGRHPHRFRRRLSLLHLLQQPAVQERVARGAVDRRGRHPH